MLFRVRRMSAYISILPEPVRQSLERMPLLDRRRLEEIRLRVGVPAAVVVDGSERELFLNGAKIIADSRMLNHTVTAAADHCLYTAEDQLRHGYRTLKGGHRLGVCGTVVRDRQGIAAIGSFSSLNLRIARQLQGVSAPIFDQLYGTPASTLVIGAPGRGKTTVLRDLIRLLSARMDARVGVVDERGEIAACVEGSPQFDIGSHTDVISGATKEEGIYLLLRTMSPEWIALDEISEHSDIETICRASYCGVRFIATAHAWHPSDLRSRPLYRALMERKIFRNLVVIDKDRRLRVERITND